MRQRLFNMKQFSLLSVFIIAFLHVPLSEAEPQVVAVGIPEIEDEVENDFGIPDSCVDLDRQCASFQENRECENSPSYMEYACPRTCGTCRPESRVKNCADLRPECQAWGRRGDCDLVPGFMNVNCPQTCKSCPPASIDDCVDQHETCFIASLAGVCRTNPSFYLIFCPDSCKKYIPVCNTKRSSTVRDLCLDQARGIDFVCGVDPTTAAVSRKKRHIDHETSHSWSNTSLFEPWRDYQSYTDIWNKIFSRDNKVLEDLHDREKMKDISKNTDEAKNYVNPQENSLDSPTKMRAVENSISIFSNFREIYKVFTAITEFFNDELKDGCLSYSDVEASSLNNLNRKRRQANGETSLFDFCSITLPLSPETTTEIFEIPNLYININICVIIVAVVVPIIAFVVIPIIPIDVREEATEQPPIILVQNVFFNILQVLPPPILFIPVPVLPVENSTVQPTTTPTPFPTPRPSIIQPRPAPTVTARVRTLVPFCTVDGYQSLVARLKRLIGRNTGRPISPIAVSLIVAINFCHHGIGLPETTLGEMPPAPDHFQVPSGMEIFLNDLFSIDLLQSPKRFPGISLPAMHLYQDDNKPPPPPKRDRPTTVITTVLVNGTVVSNVTRTLPGAAEFPVDLGSIPSQTPMDTPKHQEIKKPVHVLSETPNILESMDTISSYPEVPEPMDTFSEGSDSLRPVESSLIDSARQESRESSGPVPVDAENLRSRDSFSCGGALITPYHVLTAAHCLVDRRVGQTTGRAKYLKPSVVRLGEVDFNNPSESQAFDYAVSGIQVHEEYALPIKYNDIAIITLRDRVEFTSALRPFCLPRQPQDLVGRVCTVSGWGTLPSGFVSSVLHDVDVQVVSQGDCQNVYTGDPATSPSFNEQYPNGIASNILCAGIINDVCRGDSGGPLVLSEGGILQEVGIVSSGFGCRSAQYPGIYTRVDQYTDWIRDELYGDCDSVLSR